MDDYVVVSLSGGKDSTAVLLRMIEIGEHIDEVIFCDSTVEFPTMYDHINKLKEYSENHGIKFTILKSPHDFEYFMFEIPIKSDKYGDHKGYGWPLTNTGWCNSYLKVRVINRYLSSLRKKYNIIQCIGLCADEEYRVKRKSNDKRGRRYPLVEWGWSEADCLNYCYSRGYDWGGLYRIFERTSCWCCPLQPVKCLKNLYKYHPELWRKLEEWEDRLNESGQYHTKFKAGYYTVHQLSERFKSEVQCERLNEIFKQKKLDDFLTEE